MAIGALIAAGLPGSARAQQEPRPRATDPFQVDEVVADDAATDQPLPAVLVDEPITAQIVTVDGRHKAPRIQGRRLDTRVDTRITNRISSRQGARVIDTILALDGILPETLPAEPE